MANGTFSTASSLFLQSLVDTDVVVEMMNGDEVGKSLAVTAQLRGTLVDVYEDALVLDQGRPAPTLVFARAIRAVYAKEPAVTAPPKATPGAKLF